jgi:hypothetical protein
MDIEQERFQAAIERFDVANAADPRKISVQGQEVPQELLYAQRMTAWLERLVPDASEVLRLAARCQHICRWEIPRDQYPRDRDGYHQWRTRLYAFHADRAERILREVGYGRETVERVRDLLMKKRIKSDPEMQALEDVICLVFLEHYFADFSSQHDEQKMIRILQRTWRKMSSKGQAVAGELNLTPSGSKLLKRALQNL